MRPHHPPPTILLALVGVLAGCTAAEVSPGKSGRDSSAPDDTADTGETSDTTDTGDTADCTAAKRPFPQHVAYPGAVIGPSGDVDAHDAAVLAYYRVWADHYLQEVAPAEAGDRRFRVLFADAADADTVSEGQGYGMVLTATMAGADPDAQARFDGLWRYRLDHPSEIDDRMMDWLVPADEARNPGDDDSAFDGDADMALGLLLADAQWGSGCGVDYRAEAERVLAGLHASVVGQESALPLLGDWVGGGTYDQWDFRTSDVMPASFAAFATVDPAWEDVRVASLAACAAVAAQLAPETGLLPDFVEDGADGQWSSTPGYLEGGTDDDWSYNAVRVPWRFGFGAVAADDTEAGALALTMSRWIATKVGGDPTRIHGGYALDGGDLPGTNYFDPLFGATFGPAAMADPDGQAWLDAIWSAVSDAHEDYFSDSITLQSLLVMSGNAWIPE